MSTPLRASDFNGDLSEFLNGYKYQPNLTRKLNDLGGISFAPELLNEIVLWKVNRCVSLDPDQLGRHRRSGKTEAGGRRAQDRSSTNFLMPMALTFRWHQRSSDFGTPMCSKSSTAMRTGRYTARSTRCTRRPR